MAATSLTGCAQYTVRLEGERRATVSEVARPECGPIRPRIDSVAFDRSHGLLRLAVSLLNAGPAAATTPARLYGWEDSLAVLEPPGLAQNRHTGEYLVLQDPDSTGSDGTLLWRYDSLLAAGNRLPVGAASAPRWIEIAVHQGVSSLLVTFGAEVKRAGAPVPATAPDTVPGYIAHDSMVVTDADGRTKFVRDVILVAFRPGTAQDLRQQAIDAVGGTVIGGRRLNSQDGLYVVQLPAGGRLSPLLTAVARLQALPHVSYATENWVGLVQPHYRAPRDGVGWRQWRVNRTESDGENWAQEDIAAPLAWGCESGSRNVKTGVVDFGIHVGADLTPNVVLSELAGSSPTLQHGTFVSSVLAARGDNGVGMTGMLWQASLALYEVTALDNWLEMQWKIVRAVRWGARVLNLSLGRQFVGVTAYDSIQVARMRDGLVNTLRFVAVEDHHPLVVVAAGNDSVDAWWAGFPAARDTLPDQIMVVGAIARTGALAQLSNRGHLVDLLAPGVDVFVIDSAGSVLSASGTSLAAPLVSGIAGLLLSRDLGLTASQLKQLIITGAQRGGRVADGIPIVNAYESLRAAAEARGAPLCGNRVWATGGQLIAERDRAAGTHEVLANIGEPAYDLNVRHGGRRIEFRGDNSHTRRAFVLGPTGTWSEVPESDTTARLADGGTFLSAGQLSHNGDSGVVLRQVPAGFDVTIIDGRTRTREVIATISAVADYSGLGDGCLLWDGPHVTCVYPTAVGSYTAPFAHVAWAPPGDRVYVAVGHVNGTTSITGEVPGPVPSDPHPCFEGCWFATWASVTSTSGDALYVINIRGDRTPRLVGPLAVAPAWLAVSEDGAEVIVGRGTTTTASTGIGDVQESSAFTQANCGLTFVTSAGGTTTRTVAVPEVCTQFQGTGTIAPVARPQIARAARPSVGRPEHSAQRVLVTFW